MARKFKITEEQYKALQELQEGVKTTLAVNPSKNQSIDDACRETMDNFKMNGGKADNADLTVDGTTLTEHQIITKKQIMESRLKALKANSTVFKMKDFRQKLSK